MFKIFDLFQNFSVYYNFGFYRVLPLHCHDLLSDIFVLKIQKYCSNYKLPSANVILFPVNIINGHYQTN